MWLTAGLVCCTLAALFIRVNIERRKKTLQKFVSSHLLADLTRNVSLSRRRIKNILFVLGIAFLFIGLARPQYGNRWVEVRRKGIDILIGVDVSKSMLVRDITPNRLERSKLAIKDFVAKLEGDRVGLLPFAGTSFLMCPLTTDYEAFYNSLDALDINTIPKGGTDIGRVILDAEKILSNEANHKILVLVTDGEDLSQNALDAAKKAKEHGMTIYTIGVGTPKGELIPAPGKDANEFIKDANGNFVTSKLDEQTLSKIAEATGGVYMPLGNTGQGFDAIYQQKLSLLPKEEHGQRKRKVPVERFSWALALAASLLAADFLITGRKNRWALRLPFIKTASRRKKELSSALALLFFLGSWAPGTRASRGEEFFQAGEYDQAGKYYRQALKDAPDNPRLHFNLGDTAYRQKNYAQAIAEFNEALKTDDLGLQAKSYFNRGNALFFQGKSAQKTDPENTIQLWQQSLDSYKASLELHPDDADARRNLEHVRKKLEKLKQKEKQKKKKKQQNQKKNKKNQDKKNKKGKKKEKDSKKQQKVKQESAQKNDSKKQQDPQQPKSSDKKDKKGTQAQQQKADMNKGKKEKQKKQAADQLRQDKQRRLQGKMTKEEAKNLLNSLKSEQKELNFLPRDMDLNDTGTKDW